MINPKICKICSDRIIEQLDAGVVPWRQGFVASRGAKSHSTGKSYSLLNQMLLGAGGEYATFKQVSDEGGKVKKGAKSKVVVFWKLLGLEKDEDGNIVPDLRFDKPIPFLQYYRVFSLDDCEGIKAKYPEVFPNVAVANEQADAVWQDYCKREGIPIEFLLTDACPAYIPALDKIRVPKREQYVSTEEFYSALFHELIHSTGKKSRLNRDMETDKKSKSYAQEELTAEIGACALLASFGMDTQAVFENNAAYIKHWRDRIAQDNSLIILAAGRAQKAVDYILNDGSENDSESSDE